MKVSHALRVVSVVLATVMSYPIVAYSATTVFHYRVNDSDEAGLPDIPSVGGEDGIADDIVEFSDDIPTAGVPDGAGNRSIDGAGAGGVNSADIDELDNFEIANEGGFTYETWFKWDGFGDINSIIDYAGTEKLVIDVNQGEELRMRINSDGGLDTFIGEVSADEWYYTAVVFDTEGNEVENGSITGVFTVYLDGEVVDTTDEVTISDFGDSLDRTIGVAKHPQGFPRDYFNGLVYEPRVSLGALSQAELLYVSGELGGDYNGDGMVDVADVDLQAQAMKDPNPDLGTFDENGDGSVNLEDRQIWVDVHAKTWMGDSNFDGEFNSGDLVAVFAAGKYETAQMASWADGDWDGDMSFDSGDLVVAFAGGGYEQGPKAVPAVPEPSATGLLWLGIGIAVAWRRRCRGSYC